MRARPAPAGGRLAGRLEEPRDGAGLPATLGQLGIAEPDLEQLAERASRQWTLNFNPREASRDDLLQLYRHAL